MNLSRAYPLFNEYYYQHRTPFVKTFHTHPQYEVYYFHQGRCDYLIGDRVFELKPGDAIILNGMTLHGPIVDRESEYVRSMFSFYPEVVRSFQRALGPLNPLRPFEAPSNRPIRLEGERKKEMEDLLRRIDKYYRSPSPVEFNRFLLAFFDLLWFLYGEHGKAAEQPAGETDPGRADKERNVRAVIDWIERRYREPVTLDLLEKNVYMSKHHLSRIFRELTGTSIIDYLYKYRIHQAKIRFSQNRSSTVSDVCREVGFTSLSHFSRLFKKFVGMTPEQYRKKVQPQWLEPSAFRLPTLEAVPDTSNDR